jgi:hypothetical protein
MAMRTYPARYRLPQKHCTEIGRIISRFAVLESRLAKCAYVLLSVSPKAGRVAVRVGRVESALTVIEDLLHIAGLTVQSDIKKWKTPFKKLEVARDLMAHGVWVRNDADSIPVVQFASGSYSEEPGGPSIRARINPQGVKVPVQYLRDVVRHIDAAVKAVDQLGAQIDAAKARKRQTLPLEPF